MTVSFANLRTIIQRDIGDSSNSTAVDQAIDAAQREVARLHFWPELRVRAFFNTEAAYSTGTVATNGTTTVTLTTGTWPTTVASSKYRFALSVSDPWYEVATRSSGAIILLAQAYIDADQTASDYIVYKSHYSLASTVDRVEEMWLHDAGRAVPLINAASDQRVSDFSHYPSGPGVPTHYLNIERDSSDNRQVLLGPDTPDDVYRVEYVSRKKTTDGTFSLDQSRWPLVACRAKAILYEATHYERSLREMERFRVLLAQEIASESESETTHFQVGQGRVEMQGGDDYLDSLMGLGRVQDPS